MLPLLNHCSDLMMATKSAGIIVAKQISYFTSTSFATDTVIAIINQGLFETEISEWNYMIYPQNPQRNSQT